VAAEIQAVTVDSFLKRKREREELEVQLHRIAELKALKTAAEAELKVLTPEVASLLASYGIRKVAYEGMEHLVYNGTNVTVSGEKAKEAMLHFGIDPDVIQAVLAAATTRTPYTTITTTAAKVKAELGGLTGK